MAHYSQLTGYTSEKIVELGLMTMGWQVSRPVVDESYDLLVHKPDTPPDQFLRLQVKTIRRRDDRKNEMVIYATNGRKRPYTKDDCDYLVGVEGTTFYFVPCIGQQEYWASDEKAAQKWERFELDLSKTTKRN